MSAGELTGKQILALLHELANRLAARGIHGDVKLVGGDALVPHGIGNRPTADIDASYAEKTSVNSIVAQMAADYDLTSDWLNSKASAFIPEQPCDDSPHATCARYRTCETSANKSAASRFIPAAYRQPLKHLA